MHLRVDKAASLCIWPQATGCRRTCVCPTVFKASGSPHIGLYYYYGEECSCNNIRNHLWHASSLLMDYYELCEGSLKLVLRPLHYFSPIFTLMDFSKGYGFGINIMFLPMGQHGPPHTVAVHTDQITLHCIDADSALQTMIQGSPTHRIGIRSPPRMDP